MKKIFVLFTLLCCSYTLFSQNDTLHWSATRQLSWTDFKSDVPDTATTNAYADIEIVANSKNAAKYSFSNSYVVTILDRNKSWVKPKMDSEMFLKYFQVMFDIGELYSRKLRKSIKEIKLDPYPVTFQEKIKAAQIGQMDRLKQFKKESKDGTFEAAVTRWYDNVKAELTELDTFKQDPAKAAK